MKKCINRLVMICIFCMALSFLVSGKVQAAAKEYQGLRYYYETEYRFWEYEGQDLQTDTVIGYGIVIADYVGKEEEVVIPEQIDGIPVTSITTGCFMGNSYVKKVTIPDSVSQMGKAVFYGCENLQEVKLSNNENIWRLPEATFAYCKNLKSIVIPEGYSKICENAFYRCTSLHTVIDNHTKGSTCMSMIERSAFEGCKNLQNIDLSHTTLIYDRAFKGCKSLKSICIGDTGKEAFSGCTSLEEIQFQDGIYIKDKAFYNCKKLKRIECDGYPMEEIGKNAFKNIHKKAVFVVQKRYAKKWKQFLTKKTGFKQTMKIKTKKNEKY